MRARRELVPRGAHAVAGGEQALDGGHRAVAPVPAARQVRRHAVVFLLVGARRADIGRPRDPDAAAARMRAEQVGLGGHQLAHLLLGFDVLADPDAALADAHVEEVFPGLGLEVLDFLGRQRLAQLAQRGDGVHVDRAAAFLHLLEHEVVAQARCRHRRLAIRRVVVEHLLVLDHVVFAVGVDGLGLEEQEPGTHRAVAVLEARRHEAVFHHRQLGAGLGGHGVGGAGVPHRVPGAARAFAHRARTEQVDAAAGGQQHGLGLVDVDAVLAHREAHRAGDARGVVLVVDELDDEDALLDAVQAQRLLGRLGDDPLVRLAVDHDLPLARAHRLAAVLQRRQVFLECLGAVVAHAVGVGLPDRQAPFLEQVHRFVDVAPEVVGQVVARDAHQVVGDHARVVGRVLLGADVGVDRRQALGHGAGTVHRRLVDELDLQLLPGLGLHGLGPAHHFISRTAAGHAAADEQDVQFFLDDFGILEGTHDVSLSQRWLLGRAHLARSSSPPRPAR